MSMFLNESTGYTPKDVHVLEEDGILSPMRKFYSGSDSSDVSDFTEQLNKATTKAEVQKVIDKIEKSLEHTEKWLKDAPLEHIVKGGNMRKSYAESEDNRKKIKQESILLKGLKSRAQGKLRSLKN